MKPNTSFREKIRKSAVLLPIAILGIALIAQPSMLPISASHSGTGSNGGTCTTDGSGHVFGPGSISLTSTDVSGNVTITYVVETECLVKGASANDNATATYFISATCTTTGTPSCPTDAGTIGTYTAAANACNQSGGACTIGSVSAASGATIPIDGTPVSILNGTATLDAFPPKGSNIVAQLGSIDITEPVGFSDTGPIGFSIAFKK